MFFIILILFWSYSQKKNQWKAVHKLKLLENFSHVHQYHVLTC